MCYDAQSIFTERAFKTTSDSFFDKHMFSSTSTICLVRSVLISCYIVILQMLFHWEHPPLGHSFWLTHVLLSVHWYDFKVSLHMQQERTYIFFGVSRITCQLCFLCTLLCSAANLKYIFLKHKNVLLMTRKYFSITLNYPIKFAFNLV